MKSAAYEARIWAALGDARSGVNLGAGTGPYEPRNREVIAVEPSSRTPPELDIGLWLVCAKP